MSYIICDLDGTLCNSQWRSSYAQAGEWDDFHKRCYLDSPNKDVLDLIHALTNHTDAMEYSFIGLTGRSEEYRKPTMDWLTDQFIPFEILLMRPAGDFTSDIELKPRLLGEYISSLNKDLLDNPEFGGGPLDIAMNCVAFILEDRDRMVEVWRDLGFNCWQVRPGGY